MQESDTVHFPKRTGSASLLGCGGGEGGKEQKAVFHPGLFDLRIRDPGWVKNQDPDPGSGSGMNIPDPISESLKTIFWVKNI